MKAIALMSGLFFIQYTSPVLLQKFGFSTAKDFEEAVALLELNEETPNGQVQRDCSAAICVGTKKPHLRNASKELGLRIEF